MDVHRTHAVEPIKSMYDLRVKIRWDIEVESIPYTYIASNCFAGYFLPNFVQLDCTTPPRDKVVIYGDGNSKGLSQVLLNENGGVYVKEDDIGTYTINAVGDPRTLNKILYLRLPANTLSFNELVTLWEKKIGKTLVKDYLSGEKVLKLIEG